MYCTQWAGYAFGLPAEQYALDTGNDPAEFTKKNIETFRRQINARVQL